MGLQTFVKVGEITNLSDARYCAGMGVDLLGFNVVEGTPGYVDPEKFAEIAGWVVGVSYCAEISDYYPGKELMESLKNADISYIESTSLEILKNLTGFSKIFKLTIDSENDIHQLIDSYPEADDICDYILIESDNDQLFDQIDQSLRSVSGDARVLKAYNLTEKNVMTLNADIFNGVALKGSEEIKPGYKDFDELAEILEALDVD
ncbi:MAG: phosphoribosylanthranilate isomerase [Bacteroidota bacterium]